MIRMVFLKHNISNERMGGVKYQRKDSLKGSLHERHPHHRLWGRDRFQVGHIALGFSPVVASGKAVWTIELSGAKANSNKLLGNLMVE